MIIIMMIIMVIIITIVIKNGTTCLNEKICSLRGMNIGLSDATSAISIER